MSESVKIGITGLPSAGKTFALKKVIEMLEGEGHSVGGMVTEPMMRRNRRIGFFVVDWITKEKKI
ncbi:MAG: nucleotide kinase, partial [Thermoplasmata archaeon]|nr:nucleotide kinase [Thermoplasmata archaeon]